MSELEELLALAEAKGMDTKLLIETIEQATIVTNASTEFIAQALLDVSKTDWEKRL